MTMKNRVTGITYPSSATNSFTYNGLGLRVSKNDSAGAFAYVCDGTDVASAVLKDGKATFTPGLSERRGTVSKFTHKDALGSTRGITDTTQATTDAILYDAFGMTVSRTGTTPTPFGFVGGAQYQTDADSGLMLLGHRYYDASVGRFISSDPIQAGDNWYAYCENNPLKSIDPSGLSTNNGKVKNNSGTTQWGYGDTDPTQYTPTPIFPGDPSSPVQMIPTPINKGGKKQIAFPYKDGDGNTHYIFPVLPGQTVGGGGIDIDAGWDPIIKKWIKVRGEPSQGGNWAGPPLIIGLPVLGKKQIGKNQGTFDPGWGGGQGWPDWTKKWTIPDPVTLTP